MSQAEVNIGLFGHVDHGKTTLVKQLTGKWTDTHSEELKRGISIKLGYADLSVYFCESCSLFTSKEKCPQCGNKTKFRRKISFVDSPGHESLMANAVAASSIIDGALFLIAANEEFPQEQTKEHLEILKLIGVKNIVVVQTKIDLVEKEKAKKQAEEIKEYFRQKFGYVPIIIPSSATYSLNIDKIIKAIELFIPTPERDPSKDFVAYVLRSFDVNKPGTPVKELKGGVIGVTISSGTIKKGDRVSIFPGYFGEKETLPLSSEVLYLMEEKEKLETANPGGLIAIATSLDPSLTRSDALAGNVVVKEDKKDLVKVYDKVIKIKYSLIEREDFENPLLKEREALLINVNTATTAGVIIELKKGIATVVLKRPIAVVGKEKLAISRRIGNRWRLSAIGEVVEKT